MTLFKVQEGFFIFVNVYLSLENKGMGMRGE
jgi:hypothetical protein